MNADFTWEFWLYPNSVTGSAHILADGAPNMTIQFDSTNGNQIIVFDGATRLIGAVATNVWTHFALVRSGTTVQAYFNGTAAGSSWTNSSTTIFNLSSGFVAARGTPSNYYTGYISNLRVVKGTAVYTANFTPPTTPLTAITNTSLLLNFTNAGIFDAATINDGQTVGNAQVSTTQAKWSPTSMAFDGTGDWLSLVGGNQSRLFDQLTASGKVNTVELWLYLVSRNGSRDFLIGNCNGGSGWSYDLDPPGNVVIETGGGVTNVTLSTKVSTGVWQHLAFVNNGTNIIVYLNGTNVGSTAVLSPASNTLPLTVGGRQDNSLIINGYIQDLRITNGVARYTANFTAPTAAFPTL
jgi:hypothetical protein